MLNFLNSFGLPIENPDFIRFYENVQNVEYLKLKNHQDFHGNSVVGEATHYVSHAWDSPFIELISALDVMITTKKLNPAKTFFLD